MTRLFRARHIFSFIYSALITLGGLAGVGPLYRLEPISRIEFVYLPPGHFLMGSPQEELERNADETQHEVHLTKGFWIGRMEVTRAQWEHVMGPIEGHPNKPNPFRFDNPSIPMVSISFFDIEDYLARLNALSKGQRFRLPTEAEWEYACRAGTVTTFNTGLKLEESQSNLDARVQYGAQTIGVALQRPSPVGSYPPNAWGLYDFHGNVWEWTSDWYGLYPSGISVNPKGPRRGTLKVIRGGSWAFNASSARSACRYHHNPEDWGSSLGFRVIWEPITNK